MIKIITAIDSLRGIGKDKTIPWDLPSDKSYYRNKVTSSGVILMGYGTYLSHPKTLTPDATEYVYIKPEYTKRADFEPLASGFSPVYSLPGFFARHSNVWVIGGSELYEEALPFASELWITQVDGVYGCDKYFPSFEHAFELHNKSRIMSENGISFQYQLWKPSTHNNSDEWDEEERNY